MKKSNNKTETDYREIFHHHLNNWLYQKINESDFLSFLEDKKKKFFPDSSSITSITFDDTSNMRDTSDKLFLGMIETKEVIELIEAQASYSSNGASLPEARASELKFVENHGASQDSSFEENIDTETHSNSAKTEPTLTQFRLSVGTLPEAREPGSFPEFPLSSPQRTVRGFMEKHQHLSGTKPPTFLLPDGIDLIPDVIDLIFEFLDNSDLINSRMVCKFWYIHAVPILKKRKAELCTLKHLPYRDETKLNYFYFNSVGHINVTQSITLSNAADFLNSSKPENKKSDCFSSDKYHSAESSKLQEMVARACHQEIKRIGEEWHFQFPGQRKGEQEVVTEIGYRKHSLTGRVNAAMSSLRKKLKLINETAALDFYKQDLIISFTDVLGTSTYFSVFLHGGYSYKILTSFSNCEGDSIENQDMFNKANHTDTFKVALTPIALTVLALGACFSLDYMHKAGLISFAAMKNRESMELVKEALNKTLFDMKLTMRFFDQYRYISMLLCRIDPFVVDSTEGAINKSAHEKNIFILEICQSPDVDKKFKFLKSENGDDYDNDVFALSIDKDKRVRCQVWRLGRTTALHNEPVDFGELSESILDAEVAKPIGAKFFDLACPM